MMDWFKFYFVSGEAFFGGAGVIAIACMLGVFCRAKMTRWARLAVHFMMVLGFAMVLISTTPMWQWFYGVWVGAGLVWAGAEVFRRRWSYGLYFGILACTLAGVLIEWPHRQMGKIQGPFAELYVVGDSVSQGSFGEDMPWPAVLAKKHQIKVTNLAIGGATVGSAMRQAEKIKADRTLVLLEIGGNDLLGFTPPAEFKKNLDDLLRVISEVPGRGLVMFELPLFPSRQVFGTIQRELARKYNVVLIPKRYFAGILCGPGATVDGIHLSDAGHERMAAMVWELVGDAVKK